MSLLNDIYTNPKTGFSNLKKMYELLKKKGFTYKDILEYLKNNEVQQLHRPKQKTDFFPIYGTPGTYQADLFFYEFIKGSNANYGTFLSCINVNTKYAFVIPLKNKNKESIKEAFQKVLKQTEIKTLGTDNGKEFLNNTLSKFFEDNNIEHYTADKGDHNKLGVIERFNRTIKGYINKWLTYTNKKKFIDVLPDLVYNYNNSYHSSIKMKPSEVTEEDENKIILSKIKKTIRIIDKTDIDIGDKVRIPLDKTIFDKQGINYSKEIYEVVKNNGLSLSLKGLKRKYKPYELIKVNNIIKYESSEKPINIQLKEAKKEKSRKEYLKREGIDEKNILTTKRERRKP